MDQENGLNKEDSEVKKQLDDEPVTLWGFIKETVKFALLSLIIVAPIRIFIAQPFLVSGSSMSPTFSNGDYLIIDQLSYYFEKPERGQVIVFKYPNDTSKFFIKRIVGLPNEVVDLENGQVFIKPNIDSETRIELDESYIQNKDLLGNGEVRFILGSDEYFVMGDNRIASSDSREWGPLQRKFVTGHVLLRLLPVNNVGFRPGQYPNYANIFSTKINLSK